MSKNYLFTSESVTEGHPDKVADQISDAVLDGVLEHDKLGRVACETLVTTGLVLVAGEITTEAYVDLPLVVRGTLREIGYVDGDYGMDCKTCSVMSAIDPQSGDIAQGVDTGGAGDQGLMFGYACTETPALMPFPIFTAHRLTEQMARVRKDGTVPWLRPDGKSQVSVYYEDGKPKKVTAVVIAAQHDPEVSTEQINREVEERVIRAVIPAPMLDKDTKFHINPTGRFVTGGPQGDTGLTGRKIIVDTYGGMGRHGGGCFSGKDPTKVDRSASYMARHVAKNIVASGLASRAEVQLAYAIGVAHPVSVMVETFGTATVDESCIVRGVNELFPLTPWGIIEYLDLRRPIFKKTAAYGHFGRELPEFTWETTTRAVELKDYCCPKGGSK